MSNFFYQNLFEFNCMSDWTHKRSRQNRDNGKGNEQTCEGLLGQNLCSALLLMGLRITNFFISFLLIWSSSSASRWWHLLVRKKVVWLVVSLQLSGHVVGIAFFLFAMFGADDYNITRLRLRKSWKSQMHKGCSWWSWSLHLLRQERSQLSLTLEILNWNSHIPIASYIWPSSCEMYFAPAVKKKSTKHSGSFGPVERSECITWWSNILSHDSSCYKWWAFHHQEIHGSYIRAMSFVLALRIDQIFSHHLHVTLLFRPHTHSLLKYCDEVSRGSK